MSHYDVLVVDDSEDIRALLELILRRKRPEWDVVGSVGDGRLGVDAAKRLQPDLVLLDLAMPEMDGLTALPLIRQAAPDTRVVVLSGFPSDAARQAARDAGAVGYVEKDDLAAGLVPALDDILASL